jgi:NAD(P)-dependent dehydrogenase (short-subunit alcohol dehydrogenase family)
MINVAAALAIPSFESSANTECSSREKCLRVPKMPVIQSEEGHGSGVEGGWRCSFVQLDVTDSPSVRAAAQTIESETGGLDVLVNNAGISSAPDHAFVLRPGDCAEHSHGMRRTSLQSLGYRRR